MNRSPKFEGRVRIFDNSSFKKLARAMRRGRVPPERMGIIARAVKRTAERNAY